MLMLEKKGKGKKICSSVKCKYFVSQCHHCRNEYEEEWNVLYEHKKGAIFFDMFLFLFTFTVALYHLLKYFHSFMLIAQIIGISSHIKEEKTFVVTVKKLKRKNKFYIMSFMPISKNFSIFSFVCISEGVESFINVIH